MWVRNGFQILSRIFVNRPSAVYVNLTKMPFYAVAKGRSVGIFNTWAECEAQVKGFSGAKYKKFDSESSAKDFIGTAGAVSYGTLPKPTQSSAQNSISTTYNKRSFAASSSSRTNGNSSRSKTKTKSPESQESSESDNDVSFDDGLDKILNKQMDDIEKRLKSFEKGIDKIEKKNTKNVPRAAIMIEPPKPKKARKYNNEFEVGDDGYIQVYTDGACSANGRTAAKAGIGVYWGDDHHLNVSEPVSGRATNNCGEIQAATKAIKQAVDNGIEKLTINTDSQFLINAVTKWMSGNLVSHFSPCYFSYCIL